MDSPRAVLRAMLRDEVSVKPTQLDALVAELGGVDTRERATAWFMPSFNPECGVVLVRDGAGWRGWWVATLRVTGADPVLSWLDPTTSREPLPLDPAELDALAGQVYAAAAIVPPRSGEIVLDGCVFNLAIVTEGHAASRSGHLSHRGESDVRALAAAFCALAETRARWEATRDAFSGLRGYLP